MESLYLNKLTIVRQSQEKLNDIEEEIKKAFKSPQFLKIVSLSFLEVILTIFAIWLTIVFAGVCLDIPKLLAIKSIADLSYAVPFPAALGTLEISQAFIFRVLGFKAAEGVAFSLILRGLNLVIAFFGLIILGWMQIKFLNRRIIDFFLAFFPEKQPRQQVKE